MLLVSSYPPRHCGIGAYARHQVERLRADGHEVTVLSPPDGDGDIHEPFPGGGAFRRAARIGGAFDRIVVHFQPALYSATRRPVAKIVTSASLLWLVARRRRATELMLHETDAPVWWRPDYLLLWMAFAAARRLSFHTQAERAAFEREYRLRPGGRASVVPHPGGPSIEPGAIGRAEARSRLGVAAAARPLFLCLGFVQPSKGFDRALEAFARVFGSGEDAARDGSGAAAALYLVGSVREDTAENLAYATRLWARAREVPGARAIDRWLSDEEFDLWIAAADRVVLPYRRSWSSGVLARAHELGTPAIVMDVGGLSEQAGRDDIVVSGDDELADALGRLAREAAARATGATS